MKTSGGNFDVAISSGLFSFSWPTLSTSFSRTSSRGGGPDEKSLSPILEVQGLRFKRQQAVQVDIPHLIAYEKEVLAHLVRPREGRIILEGKEIDFNRDQPRYRRILTMVSREPLLFDTTVFENVASGLKFRGLKKKEIEEKVEHCLKRFRIGHLQHRPARLLSGREAQRTSPARAFAVEPRILLLDEGSKRLSGPCHEPSSLGTLSEGGVGLRVPFDSLRHPSLG